MSGTLVHLSSFKNLGDCLVLGIEYSWVPAGNGQSVG